MPRLVSTQVYEECRADLRAVGSIPQVCRMWRKNSKTVMGHIDRGEFVAEKISAKCWLVSLASVRSYWGAEKESR